MKKPATTQAVEFARQCAAAGMTFNIANIARVHGINRVTLSRLLKAAGIRKPSR